MSRRDSSTIEKPAERFPTFSLDDKVAAVTGAGGGIGRALAVGIAQCGADVVVADIDDEGARETVRRVEAFGRQGLAIHCDVSDPEDTASLFSAIDERFGRIDVLINNAGIIARARPEELSLEHWQRVIGVNLTGAFLCSAEAGKRMMDRGEGGSIINVSSIAGRSALGRGNFVYSTTKGALNQLTRELAVEWAPWSIRVNAIMPAQIRTSYFQQLIDDPSFDSDTLIDGILRGIPLDRLGEPEDLLGPVLLLASDAGSFITGALIPVDGGNLALNAGGSKVW